MFLTYKSKCVIKLFSLSLSVISFGVGNANERLQPLHADQIKLFPQTRQNEKVKKQYLKQEPCKHTKNLLLQLLSPFSLYLVHPLI